MHYFYTPDINTPVYVLSEEESKHAVRVLRLIEGDTITLLDGKGTIYEAQVENPAAKACAVKVISQKHVDKAGFSIQMAVAPTKLNERFEWFLEKATEIGIDRIIPITCGRSERKELKHERMEKVIISAAKQSIKAWFPVLDKLSNFDTVVNSAIAGKKYICHCESDDLPHIKSIYNKGEAATILIGPEGDFTPAEIKKAIAQGFIPVSLGKSRLRTETAALVACHTINLINE